jgi:signal transduction histidine kinase/ActR/RegA family two-component response regulator
MPYVTADAVKSGNEARFGQLRAEEALLRTRALQDAILNSANFSIIATDHRGVIQLFNVGAEHLLGYRAVDVVNRIDPSALHDRQEVLARAQALSLEFGVPIDPGFEALAFKAARGIDDTYELTYICADRHRFPAVVSTTALRDESGQIIGYLLVGSHNSVRKRVEFELGSAMAIADQANLAKSEFLSSMSHELRTPLNAVLGFAQLINSGTPPPTAAQQRSVDQILKAGWYLLDLINEILDLALIESGKLSLSTEAISIPEAMREIQAMIEPQASRRGISLRFPRLEQPYFVTADRTRVKQILINLLSNAIKYNRLEGAVQVDCVATENRRLRISVTDTGEGLAPDQLAQLFQPFNRLGQEARDGEGTGIGLVVCKRLVELMGGVIEAQSTVGQGSVFSIELPLSAETDRTVLDIEHASAPSPSGSGGARPRTLLYVEDNPANLMLVEDIVTRRADIRLLSAHDGPGGIAMARSALPDVILMDIHLPGMNGIEALRMLRDDPVTARIPVVALSASAGARDRSRGMEAGFFGYLTKPINVAEFMDSLDRAFEAAQAPPAAAAAGSRAQ